MSIFSENLKAGRERAGLSRQNMADILGISVSAYGNYETGYRAPKLEMLPVIAEKLSTSIDKLLGYNTPSKERDLFTECKKLIESVVMDGEPLLVSKTRRLGEKEYSGVVIQRGGELGYPFARFASRAEFIAFVQGTMHDFKQSGIYLNARQQFVENALRKEEQRQAEAWKKDAEQRSAITAPSLKEECERILQYFQSKEYKELPHDEPGEAEGSKLLIEFFTKMLHRIKDEGVDRQPITSQEAVLKEELKKFITKNLRKAEAKATNRPPASQGVAESATPEDGAPKQGPTESPTPKAIPPEQEAPKPRRKRQKKSAPHRDEAPDK